MGISARVLATVDKYVHASETSVIILTYSIGHQCLMIRHGCVANLIARDTKSQLQHRALRLLVSNNCSYSYSRVRPLVPSHRIAGKVLDGSVFASLNLMTSG